MNICVFCAASEVEDKYVKPAAEFGRLIGAGGHALIWGGTDTGIMRVIADGVQKSDGKLHAITVELLKQKVRISVEETLIAKDLGERKALMLARSDAVVMLVGGIGTLDETTDVLEQKKHGLHDKPIVILNTDGFYDGLKQVLDRMEKEGFLKSSDRIRPLSELIYFADTPEDAMRYIEAHAA